MNLHEAQAFFETYRDAFNRLDGLSVADLWNGASGIADSHAADGIARLTWWPEDAPMRANQVALCDAYRRAGYGRADFVVLQLVPMGAAHAFVHVAWTLLRVDGGLLQSFHTGYQLMRTAQGWRVLLAVAHQEDLQDMAPAEPEPKNP